MKEKHKVDSKMKLTAARKEEEAKEKNKTKAPLREVKTLVAVKKTGITSVTLYWKVKVFRGKELVASNSFIETQRIEDLYRKRPYLKESHR